MKGHIYFLCAGRVPEPSHCLHPGSVKSPPAGHAPRTKANAGLSGGQGVFHVSW